jgi:hypothetical protein
MTDEHDSPSAEVSGPETSAWAGLSAAWQTSAPAPAAPLDMTAIRKRVNRFAWLIRFRNAREWGASALLIVLFADLARRADSLASALVFLAPALVVAWVAVNLWRRGRNLPPPSPSATTSEFLAHERAQLARQHVLLSRVRRWYLGPLFAVVALPHVLAFVARVREGLPLVPTLIVVASFCGEIAFFVLLDFMNRRAAKKLAAKIEALEGHE